MSDSSVEVWNPELIATAIAALGTLVAVVVAVFQSSSERRQEREKELSSLESLLSNPEVISVIKADSEGIKAVIDYYKKRDGVAVAGPSIARSIAEKIDWDIAGLIGLMVTMLLLFLVAGGKESEIPEEIFAGWLTIIGFYFGRSSGRGDASQ